MTDRDASALQCQLDAMRMARAEDAKTCARLTARVKELEAEVASLKRGQPETFDDLRAFSDEQSARAKQHLRELDESARRPLAEGTRDAKAARCAHCQVPVASRAAVGATLCNSCGGGGGAP